MGVGRARVGLCAGCRHSPKLHSLSRSVSGEMLHTLCRSDVGPGVATA